jgi:D-glycero-D-manno-heptose 1,7-bisphosphate phosphatase
MSFVNITFTFRRNTIIFVLKMKKAVFLDRDGVINVEKKDYVKCIKEFQIIEDIPKAIVELKKKGFLVIVITNQSAINRGLLTIKILNEIHNHLQEILKDNDTLIDNFYFCPHRPDENCLCRKPKPGLLLQAAKQYEIDLKDSFFIGDSQTDMEAAKAAGCKYILLKNNQKLIDVVKDQFAS